MAARSIASLTLSFGLVSIPVRLYAATDSGASVRFNLLAPDGSRLKQQFVSEKDERVVPRDEIRKGYEFEKGRFVLFTADELKALEESRSHSIDIVAFVPERSVDPLYYDKAYLLAPDKRGGKPYALLVEALRRSGRCALARWSWRARQHVVQVRPVDDGLVLQQLLPAEQVRSLKDLDIGHVEVSAAELQLALQLIEQSAEDHYDPTRFEDAEKARILAAIDEKIAGKEVVAPAPEVDREGAQIIDLMEALTASLGTRAGGARAGHRPDTVRGGERKPARRAGSGPARDGASAPAPVPMPKRAGKGSAARRQLAKR